MAAAVGYCLQELQKEKAKDLYPNGITEDSPGSRSDSDDYPGLVGLLHRHPERRARNVGCATDFHALSDPIPGSNPPTDHFQDQPVVIIEVLSDSTRRTDLGEKRDAYLTIPSLKVLILAESETPAVIVQRRKSEGGFAVEAHSGLDAIILLPEIDASLPLAELYDQVVFS
jgi:hypothetical protein